MQKGYTIVTRRFKASRGEIDLIALDGDVLVFVEVKFRSVKGMRAEENVGDIKIAHIGRAAREYLLKMEEPERQIRFDVVAIDREGLRHHIDAFRP
jgi:putative endonuclease